MATNSLTIDQNSVINAGLSDAKMKLDDAMWIGSLANWIERARHLCDSINICVDLDENLKASLKSHHIAYSNADWDTEESDGLARLLCIQRKLMNDAIKGLEVSHG